MELTMNTRREIIQKMAPEYQKATKKEERSETNSSISTNSIPCLVSILPSSHRLPNWFSKSEWIVKSRNTGMKPKPHWGEFLTPQRLMTPSSNPSKTTMKNSIQPNSNDRWSQSRTNWSRWWPWKMIQFLPPRRWIWYRILNEASNPFHQDF